MLKEGYILKFNPFIFKNGATPKAKYFIVLKEIENKVVLASLPTSKDHIPADVSLQEGCIELPDRQVNIYVFPAQKDIAIHPESQKLFSFERNTFIYGADLDTYPTEILTRQICNGETKLELMGRLSEEQFFALKECLKNSRMVKNRFKRVL